MTERDDHGNGTQHVVEIVGRVVAVRPTGEIDIDTAPSLSHALAEAISLVSASRADRIVADCSRVTFCDSSGLNALLAARLIAAKANAAVHLANPAPQLQRLLQITGAESLFPREDDLPAFGLPPAGV
ncbi:STAS domain-containing protein [Streptomyces sp. NPDC056491]|uniref:STAS domain-containing protein n=1 Tax=Streptomyces sp. NPDC056491 TaxID=3345837 RepID=UPI0036C50150